MLSDNYIKEVINSTTELYKDIDKNITDLVLSRIRKDKNKEEEHLIRMESLMCATLQQLDCLIDVLNNQISKNE